MRRKIISMFLAVCVLTLLPFQTASAYSLGENIEFNADEIEANTGGTTNSYQRTDQERQMDMANYTNNSAITDIARDYINTLDKSEQYSEVTDDGYVFAVEGDTPVEIITKITENKSNYYPGGYYYNIGTGFTGLTEDELTDEQYEVLSQAAIQRGWDSTYTSPTNDGYFELAPGEGLSSDEDLIYAEYVETLGGDIARDHPVSGNHPLIDFNNYPNRQEAIDVYRSFFAGEDTIRTEYILEIKAESISEGALWKSTPRTWPVSGQTHYWQFECIECFDGSTPATLDLFGGKNVSQSFYFPGKYHITATQILEESRYDVMTYSINEYWVIEDTGVILWKNESTGRHLRTQDEPLSELNTSLINNYNLVSEGTYYVPVYDAIIEVNNSSWEGSFTAPSTWGYDFTTKRQG